MKKILVCLILLLAAFNPTFAQKKKPVRPVKPIRTIIGAPIISSSAAIPPKLSPELERRMKSFEMVWKTIRDNYFDQTFGGLDWNNIWKEYEPRVLKTTNDEQLHNILMELIKRLKSSHFAIIPPDVFREIERVKTSARLKQKLPDASGEATSGDEEDDVDYDPLEFARYGIGVDLRLINNQFVITQVESGSAAEKAGLKTGFVIEKIDETSLKGLLEKFQNWNGAPQNFKKMLPLDLVAWFLNGEPDTTVSIAYLDEKEQPKEISIKRERLEGKLISLGSNYPEQFLSFQTKSLNTEVGYIKFNLFGLQTIEYFCASLTELKDKKAIIIDLRGNTGGLFGALIGVSGMLTDKSIDLGTQIYKVGSEKITASPKAKNFKGKLVFLTDNVSVSSAEILAAAMQENNRALIVGEKSAGEALPALSIILPTGAVFVYPFANFKTPKGNLLEGTGVVPNVTVALDKKSLLEGRDSQLETALKLIKEDTAFPKQAEKPVALGITADDAPLAPMIAKPTPKPLGTPEIRVLGSVTVDAPKIRVVAPKIEVEKDVKDEKSLQVINDFINAIGGEAELKKIESYQLSGYAQMSLKGSVINTDISIFREKPSKYAVVWKSASLGESKEVYTEKGFLSQSDFGLDKELSFAPDTAKIEIFASIYNLLNKDYFKSYTYLGAFDRDKRKAHVISAKINGAFSVTLAFDVETKMLVGYSTDYWTIFMDDYRKVGNVMLPFSIARDTLMKIIVMDIKLNQKIDESIFVKKENCFDIPN